MFETTSISASERSYYKPWGSIIVITAVLSGTLLPAMGEADIDWREVNTDWTFSAQRDTVLTAQDAVGRVLRELVRKSPRDLDDAFAIRLGFDSARQAGPLDSAEAPKLGNPIPIFQIGLKRLQQFQPAVDNPLKLLTADVNWFRPSPPTPSRFLFPISVEIGGREVVKSSVRIGAPTRMEWKIERIGSAFLINQIEKWRREHGSGAIVSTYFLVWIPALDRYYLGRVQDKDFRIRAIVTDSQVGLPEGKEAPARSVLERLKHEALAIDAQDLDAPPR